MFTILFILYIILITLSSVKSQNLVFDVDQIQCLDQNPPSSSSPCEKWKTKMSAYSDKVSCVIAESPISTFVYSGCSPAFDIHKDGISVQYKLSNHGRNLASDKPQYTLSACVKLKNPIDPISKMILIVFVAISFIFGLCNDYGKSRPFYGGYRRHYTTYRCNNISWNKV